MQRPHHPTREVSELSPSPLDVKQPTAAGSHHSSVHSLPASRQPMSRHPSISYTHRPVTTGNPSRLPYQRHGYHSSDPFVHHHQYARPVHHEASLGIAYTHHAISRAEPVPIGNRDIIVGPADELSSSSPTTASKLFLSMRRTLSLKKAQPVRLLSLKSISRGCLFTLFVHVCMTDAVAFQQLSAPPVSFVYVLESPRPPTPPEIHQIATGTKSPLPLLRRTKTGPSRVSLPPPPAHSALKKTSTLSSETSSTASGSTGALTPESGSRSGSSLSGPVDRPRLWKNKTMLARLLGGKREKSASLGHGGFLDRDESARTITPPAKKNVRFLTENDNA